MKFERTQELIRGKEILIRTFENPWFKYIDADHGYVHIQGLNDKTLEEDGPYIEKMMALCQELLKGLYMQVEEVQGDLIEFEKAEKVKYRIALARRYFGIAFDELNARKK